jgi:ATP/maltotriose-dependent transcriptional regulator MalT/DNA-binding SARP family transcriptional activator
VTDLVSDIKYVYPLIHNKVTPPHYATPTLRRARLLAWLSANANCRAIVVAADAGYGKTTLLWQWEREVDFPIYWYKLDRNDRDWSLHISYLIEAISQRHSGFGRRAHSMLQQLGGPGSSRPGVAAYLLAEMHERLTEHCTFVIDDWQAVSAVTEVRGLWNQILRDAPPTCRFIFLSRARPQLQFARFKTHGGYAAIQTDSLRFTDREIDDLFRDIYNDPLDRTELAELERRTEGWAAGLQLVEVSLRERTSSVERHAFINSITATSDSDLFAFLAEEVLDQQTEQVRNFLISTSILHQINAELAERLAGVHDGARILSDLEQRGLFTNRLDEAEVRYRYHGLFRDFLERRLVAERSNGEVTGLHIHAASYFETHEQWPQAIHHYLKATLTPQAARLIARYGEDVVSEGRLGLVDEWLQQLPDRAVKDNARLSLLHGEAAGIRGDWEAALTALGRARSFFAKKGDPRMEALACLKTSTVLSNMGEVERAAEHAARGLELAPQDAYATRLRLNGNLAITSTWMSGPLEAVIHECRRIAVEAKTRGLDHFAAIALHNLGMLLRQVGDLEGSVKSLEQAAHFWSDLPSSPFADNAELVQSLLYRDEPARAEILAKTGALRTAPWARPQAEAQYGRAAVLNHQGRFAEAASVLNHVLADPRALGATAEIGAALLIESLFLSRGSPEEIGEAAAHLTSGPSDPRQAPVIAPARAIGVHASRNCTGECLREAQILDDWDRRGATLLASIGFVKLGVLALDHKGSTARRLTMKAVTRAQEARIHRHIRWWLQRLRPRADWIVRQEGGAEAIASFANADPAAWRQTLVPLLASENGAARQPLVEFLGRHGTSETAASLRPFEGSDVSDLRRALISKHASPIFIRSFGALVVHRGSWLGPTTSIDRRRMRALLALLVANYRSTLTREMVLELLWPDSDPSSAVNSLNQAVFQLRRVLDPTFRDGDSPQYVLSTVDAVHLNPAHTVTDLDEFRRLAQQGDGSGTAMAERMKRLVDIVRGEFLADLRYDDWALRMRTAVHAEVRQVLLPVARADGRGSVDTAVRAACALLELDPYDEEAQIAMARQLNASGRRAAARKAILRFAKKLKDDLDEAPSGELENALGAWATSSTESTYS